MSSDENDPRDDSGWNDIDETPVKKPLPRGVINVRPMTERERVRRLDENGRPYSQPSPKTNGGEDDNQS